MLRAIFNHSIMLTGMYGLITTGLDFWANGRSDVENWIGPAFMLSTLPLILTGKENLIKGVATAYSAVGGYALYLSLT